MGPLLMMMAVATTNPDGLERLAFGSAASVVATSGGVVSGVVVGGAAGAVVAVASGNGVVGIGAGIVVGGAGTWVVTTLLLEALTDERWPDWVPVVTGGSVVGGVFVGAVVGFAVFLSAGKIGDDLPEEIVTWPLTGAVVGVVVGALAPTTVAVLLE